MTDKSTANDSIEDGVGRAIVNNLKPQFDPVALVWSDSMPSNAIQFKEGKFGCVLNLLAEASTRGRVAGGSRDTIVCDGARAALGLGWKFRDDILTLSIPVPLLARMEREANDSVFQIPGWLKLRTNR